ncbi:unnamed protein product [Phytomonas sp. Hart1]|nr:unnamed protein product [Phytomonas sp. Hart1]|eukprot:CCW70134.1 unnamed protein product [Phytomonas sp. isolate Hart1]
MASGERYEGGFYRNAWSGRGNYFVKDGAVLQGVFRRGRLRRLCYHGEVDSRRRPHGRGVKYSTNGSIYNGEWHHGEQRGTGVLQDLNGRIYSGEFCNGHMNGQGKLIEGGNVYYGEFVDSLKHGKGIEFFGLYAMEGQWVRGLSNGYCKLWDCITHELYETTYRNGKEQDDCFPCPIKVEDWLSLNCSNCKVGFSLFLRRHHCRLCGDVFCDACTQARATLPDHFAKRSKDGEVNRTYLDAQRVCNACTLRLRQRRILAIKRYADRSVYAGLWSQGQWVSCGLYCHPDGLFIVMDKHGNPILSKQKPSKIEHVDGEKDDNETSCEASDLKGSLASQNPTLTKTGEILKDASPSKEVLNVLTESSPYEELELFSKWWSHISTVCKLLVPLDVPPIQLCVGLLQEPSRMDANENQAEGGDTSGATRTEVENRLKCFPIPPVMPSPKLFVCLQDVYQECKTSTRKEPLEGEKEKADELTAIRNPALTHHEPYEYEDENVYCAVLRAARFTPEVIPPQPPLPFPRGVPQRTPWKNSIQAEDADAGKMANLRSYDPFFPQPPRLEDDDRSDRAVLEQIAEARLKKAAAFSPAGSPLIASTPNPPPNGTNAAIPWTDWVTREVPTYRGNAAKAEGPPAPGPSEAQSYVACPFWRPTPTDAQAALVAGKMSRAIELMLDKDARLEDGGDKNGSSFPASAPLAQDPKPPDDPSSGLSSEDDSVGTPDRGWHSLKSPRKGAPAESGVGWLPAPLAGPFTFHIRTLPVPTAGERTAKNMRRVKVSMTPYSLRNET